MSQCKTAFKMKTIGCVRSRGWSKHSWWKLMLMFEVNMASSLDCHSQWWKPLPPAENWRTKSIKVGVASNRSTSFFNVVAPINRPEGLMTLEAVQISPSAVVIQPPGRETRCLRAEWPFSWKTNHYLSVISSYLALLAFTNFWVHVWNAVNIVDCNYIIRASSTSGFDGWLK